jgi:ketosteroid isomerase-like protein
VVAASVLWGLGRREETPPTAVPPVQDVAPPPPPPSPPVAAAPAPTPDVEPPADDHGASVAPPPPAVEPPADDRGASVAPPPPATIPAVPTGPLTAAEATAAVEAFRAAYQARDADALVALFADDGRADTARGATAIGALYRERLALWKDVRVSLPALQVVGRGPRASVRGPFVVRWQRRDGTRGQTASSGEWLVERRNGQARIVAFDARPLRPAPKKRPREADDEDEDEAN